jgi:DNA-binding IclR family transcriptional regulator
MLVYRDFAEQGPDRRYGPGKVMRSAEITEAPAMLLRRLALPHLERIKAATGESANLMVLADTEVRFLLTVESDQVLRVGDRAGLALPAHDASAGRAMLAALPPERIERIYADRADVDLAKLRRDLTLIRNRGYAINDQRTETGVTAVGIAVPGAEGEPVAGISVSMPTARFHRDAVATLVAVLTRAKNALARELKLDRRLP